MVFVGQQFREGVAEMAFLLFIMSEASVGKTWWLGWLNSWRLDHPEVFSLVCLTVDAGSPDLGCQLEYLYMVSSCGLPLSMAARFWKQMSPESLLKFYCLLLPSLRTHIMPFLPISIGTKSASSNNAISAIFTSLTYFKEWKELSLTLLVNSRSIRITL